MCGKNDKLKFYILFFEMLSFSFVLHITLIVFFLFFISRFHVDKMSSAHVYLRLRKVLNILVMVYRRVELHLEMAVRQK